MNLATPAMQLYNRQWFRAISEHIYQQSGILLHGENRNIYERRIRDMAEKHGVKNLGEYYMRLRFHVHANRYTQELIEQITTGETYFFRESRQLIFGIDKLLIPKLGTSKDRPLTIWSAGCSTGEEPYTIAMLLLERAIMPSQVKILAGDINTRVLDIAREGVYRDNAFRVLPPEQKTLHFQKTPDGRFRIGERVRAMVEFTRLNLIDREALALLPRPDILFCRNVLIYFDKASKRRAIENLYECMHDDAVLLLGHAESLLNMEHRLLHEQSGGELYYRKAPR